MPGATFVNRKLPFASVTAVCRGGAPGVAGVNVMVKPASPGSPGSRTPLAFRSSNLMPPIALGINWLPNASPEKFSSHPSTK